MGLFEWVRGSTSPWAGIEGNKIPNCVTSESLTFRKYLSSATSPCDSRRVRIVPWLRLFWTHRRNRRRFGVGSANHRIIGRERD